MHRWFMFLLIALLPLRGWVGEAMAGQMLAQQLVAIEKGAARAQPVRAAGQFGIKTPHGDCMQAAAASTAAQAGHGHHGAPGATPAATSAATTSAADPTACAHPQAHAAGDCASCAQCQACSALAAVWPSVPQWPSAVAFDAPRAGVSAFASATAPRVLKPPIA
jgi:hypothetical protein